MMTSRRFHLTIVLLMNTCFVFATSRSTQMLGQKGGHQNLTLSVNETLEFRFSFTDEVNKRHNIVVHVMHQRGGVQPFDTKCIIRQSHKNCTSSAEMCRCLLEPFGSYILHKIVTKEDSGTWTFKLWNTHPEVFKILHINVEAPNTNYEELKGDYQNLTLALNKMFEIRFYFPDAVKDSHDIAVYIQHRRRGASMFDTRCFIKQSHDTCTSSAELCWCLVPPGGKYKIFTDLVLETAKC